MSSVSCHKPLDVVVGLIQDCEGRVLLGCRQPGSHMPGYWELPGGKRDSKESSQDTLYRELYEELGVRVLSAVFLVALTHRYPEQEVRLEVWQVEHYDGEPIGQEGQSLSWVLPDDFRKLPILPADEPLIDILLGR
jgi:8-oxo-dGTP diphosphatase